MLIDGEFYLIYNIRIFFIVVGFKAYGKSRIGPQPHDTFHTERAPLEPEIQVSGTVGLLLHPFVESSLLRGRTEHIGVEGLCLLAGSVRTFVPPVIDADVTLIACD